MGVRLLATAVTPPKKAADRKGLHLKVRVTEERLKRWKAAAAAAREHEDEEDLDFSAWVRRALNRAERDETAARGKPKDRR
jgi:hypothetical protein